MGHDLTAITEAEVLFRETGDSLPYIQALLIAAGQEEGWELERALLQLTAATDLLSRREGELLAAGPGLRLLRARASSLIARGLYQDAARSLPLTEAGLTDYRALLPTDDSVVFEYGELLQLRAHLAAEQEDLVEEIRALGTSIDLYANHPHDNPTLLPGALLKISQTFVRAQMHKDAVAAALEALRLAEENAQTNAQFLPYLVEALGEAADRCDAAGDQEQARALTVRAIELLRQLREGDPKRYDIDLAKTLLFSTFIAAEDDKEAMMRARESLEMMILAVDAGRDHEQIHAVLSIAVQQYTRLCQPVGRCEEALLVRAKYRLLPQKKGPRARRNGKRRG